MSKKNPSVLWTVDQHTNDNDIGKDGRLQAQKNIGIDSGLVKTVDEHDFVTGMKRNSSTNDLEYNTARPTLADLTYETANKNQSIVTDGDGKVVATSLEVSDPATSGNTDNFQFISGITQATNGKITPTKKTIATSDSVETDNSNTLATTKATHSLSTNKADKVTNATRGNFAAFDDHGNLTDSTHKHADYKTVQNPVSDPPTGSTDSISFIQTISQDDNGVITPTKENVRSASTSESGVVILADSISATISQENNKAATEKAVRDAINALDVPATGTGAITGFGANQTLASLTEDNGKVSATFQNITLGNITHEGKIGSTANMLVVTGTNGVLTTGDSSENLVHDASYNHTDNNFTSALKTKLEGIASEATKVVGYSRDTNRYDTLKINTSSKLVTGVYSNDNTNDLGCLAPVIDSNNDIGKVLTVDSSGYPEWVPMSGLVEVPYFLNPTPYNDVINALSNGNTPLVTYDIPNSYGHKQYYVLSDKLGSDSQSSYLFSQLTVANNTAHVNFFQINPDQSVTSKSIDLMTKVNISQAGGENTPIYIDTNSNFVECSGVKFDTENISGQRFSASLRNNNNPILQLTSTQGVTLERTEVTLTNIETRSYTLHTRKSSTTSGIWDFQAKFDMSPIFTVPSGQTPTDYAGAAQLSTALHSIYDGSLSATGGGSEDTPIDRVTLYGNKDNSYKINNLGNLTVGTISMRLINATSTSSNHPLLASCIPGEISLIKAGNTGLYAKHQDCDTSSYIQIGDNDGWIAVTTTARKLSDDDARSASLSNSDLGRLTFFPSKNYVDKKINEVKYRNAWLNVDPVTKMFYNHSVTLTTEMTYKNLSLSNDVEDALRMSRGSLATTTAYGMVFLSVRTQNTYNYHLHVMSGTDTKLVTYDITNKDFFSCAFPVLSNVSNFFIRLEKDSSSATSVNFTVEYTILDCKVIYSS